MTIRYSESEQEELNVWPAFTDLMSNAFIISILFLILLIVQSVATQNKRRQAEDPPIIIIEDNNDFRFESGSAQISPKMTEYLKLRLLPTIGDNIAKNDINTIEIIGHTDGTANQNRVSQY
jgi:flagellar motor protein MotB